MNPQSTPHDANIDPFTYELVCRPLGAGDPAGPAPGDMNEHSIDPTREEAYWRENYRDRPYVAEGEEFERYHPAYRYGWESFVAHRERNFHELEPHLEAEWEKHRGKMRLGWSEAKPAVRDAWDRLEFALADTQELPPPKPR